jgi:hypothetical protein
MKQRKEGLTAREGTSAQRRYPQLGCAVCPAYEHGRAGPTMIHMMGVAFSDPPDTHTGHLRYPDQCQFLISSRYWTILQHITPKPPPTARKLTAMDSPPFKPKPAIPSHLANGLLPLGVSTEARDKKERDSLYAQIQNSNRGRQVVSFNEPSGYFPKLSTSVNMDGSNGRERHQMVHSEIDVEGYNECTPTRTPLATSRAQSPYIQHPTIDFDGLSWPSR